MILYLPGNKNWAAIHERQFSKMDSLDVYLAKKRQRTASLQTSVKAMADGLRSAMDSLKKRKSPAPSLKVSIQKLLMHYDK